MIGQGLQKGFQRSVGILGAREAVLNNVVIAAASAKPEAASASFRGFEPMAEAIIDLPSRLSEAKPL